MDETLPYVSDIGMQKHQDQIGSLLDALHGATIQLSEKLTPVCERAISHTARVRGVAIK